MKYLARKPHTQLRFLCFGVGAIGTYIGGSLALAGHKVVFLEHPDIANDVKRRGLRLQLGNENYHYSNPDIVATIDNALTLGPFDLAIFAVKAYDTQSLIQSLMTYRVALPPFLCFQNGVENEAVLSDALGDEKVIAGTVTTAIGKRGAGDIVMERLRGVGIASNHNLTPTLVAVMDAAGLRARQYHNAQSMKWSKMVTNLLSNATSAILDMTPAEIFAHPGLFRLEVQQLREVLQVMRVQRIPVTNLPGTPVKLLSMSVTLLPEKISQPLLIRAVGGGRGEKMPSLHIDLQGGRGKSEVNYLNGAVARFGEKFGIKTPVNENLTRILTALVNGEMDRREFSHNPEKLLALVEKG